MFYFFAGGNVTPFEIKEKNISYISEIIKTLAFLTSFFVQPKFDVLRGGWVVSQKNVKIRFCVAM